MQAFVPDPALYPFSSHWLRLDDGSLVHYVDEGLGPVLLLLHGNPTWSFLYRKIIPRLAGRFRCIAPDLPGFGLSVASAGFGFTAAEQAAAMGEFVKALDLRDAIIFMQDWGGPIGFSIALRQPERVKGFVIGNTFAWPMMRWGQRVFSRAMGGWPGRLSALAFNGVVRAFFASGVRRRLPADEFRHYLLPFRMRSARRPTYVFPGELRKAKALLEYVRDGLPALGDKPALLTWGDSDRAFREQERQRFKKLFKFHQDVTLHNAGHFIQEDAPEHICDAILEWHESLDDRHRHSPGLKN
ncbi:MAG: alpha/beta fold hydrolase [Verrucomicrobia subdivision 3 bacterium]|nr:alpha/beta fold hydrolase [Verrucomicrobiales bacterium]MCI0745514.1 alpha/beta fold hydrolase [Limisphaerales bacterium]